MEGRAGQGAGALHGGGGLADFCASGAWASPATTSNFDGYPEYFLTSMADSKLQTLATVPTDGGKPKPTYSDVAYPKGVTAHRPYTGDDLRPSTGWHTQFEDVNNDGLVDLFIAKGNVAEMPDFAMKDPNNLLLQTAGRQVHGSRRQGRHRQRRAVRGAPPSPISTSTA